jgi:hypothetical protein
MTTLDQFRREMLGCESTPIEHSSNSQGFAAGGSAVQKAEGIEAAPLAGACAPCSLLPAHSIFGSKAL